MFCSPPPLNKTPNRININLKSLLFLVAVLTATNTFAQVGIGTNTPAASAALEVTSDANNKGILIPRITVTQKDAISNPAEGLMIYQTSAPTGFYYYTGTAWKLIMTQTDLDTKLSRVDANISLNTKVDKVIGKELSSNNFTTLEKTKLAAITGTNTGDQDLSALATTASVALKANTTDVSTNLALKVDKVIGKELSSNDYSTAEKTKLAAITGSNSGDQDLSALATTASVVLKANITDVNTSLALKANTADVTNSLALKANTTDVNTDLALKANTVDVTNSLALKANITDVNTSLALKANTADVTNSLVLKAPLASPTLVTPNIGVATGTSLSVSGQLTSTIVTGTAPLVVSSTTPVANLSIGGNAATATLANTVSTNANLTGDVISSGSNVTTIDAGRVTNAMLAGSIDLTSKVTGILSSSNGGTGNGFTTITGPTSSEKTFTLPDASATILTSNAAVSVAQGGTGYTTYADGELLIGNTTGNTLTKATLTQGTGISITNAGGVITIASAGGVANGTAAGDMLYWNGTAWVKVAAGSNGQSLIFFSGKPIWSSYTASSPSPSLPSNTVYNPITNKIWMDRNLGATQVATSSTDAASYGDLYQWGRGTDGHQIRTPLSATTTGQSSSPSPGANFLAGSSIWYTGTNPNDLWKEDGTGVNNPCPSGYRLPTYTEWEAERVSWGSNNAEGAFASPLKLPMVGNRNLMNGSLYYVDTVGYYWSSTVWISTISRNLSFDSIKAGGATSSRAFGYAVRCLKD